MLSAMHDYKPKISIVTATLNAGELLDQTIKSVASQTYKNCEHIIIDGGSTDNTISILKKHDEKISFWLSEKDNGIAEAMNKGIMKASGDLILILHSDDYLFDPNSLYNAVARLDEVNDIFAFPIIFVTESRQIQKNPLKWDSLINFKTRLWHQGVLCRKSLFERIGNFDTNLKIAMDYDFFLRAYRNGAKVKICDMPLSVMRNTGISSRLDPQTLNKRFLEEKHVHYKNCQNQILKALYKIYWQLYPTYRRLKENIKNHSIPQSSSAQNIINKKQRENNL